MSQPVETAAYFVVSEAVTNAAKHSFATAIEVRVTLDGVLYVDSPLGGPTIVAAELTCA
ncbi:hypothetical protein ACGFZB_26990 [Streptomyces cinerochromogenes]|uniref:ATP-binding protein n=1 Tax=Streptomyces cinerochromogenes TaxID=66422 RepID=A0ABW7BB29_9ACTN